MTAVQDKIVILSKYILLTAVFASLGWIYETAFVFAVFGRLRNQGFLFLPICPIYGCAIVGCYLFFGTPKQGRGFLRAVNQPIRLQLWYLLAAFFVPTVAEFLVGFVFDKAFGVYLWDYSAVPLNVFGYIALPVSAAWTVMIFLVMKYLFPPIRNWVFKIPDKTAFCLAIALLIAVGVDGWLRFANLA